MKKHNCHPHFVVVVYNNDMKLVSVKCMKYPSALRRRQAAGTAEPPGFITGNHLFLNNCHMSYVGFEPTELQLKTFDSIVWGMIWGKERGDLGTRGLVNHTHVADGEKPSGRILWSTGC